MARSASYTPKTPPTKQHEVFGMLGDQDGGACQIRLSERFDVFHDEGGCNLGTGVFSGREHQLEPHRSVRVIIL